MKNALPTTRTCEKDHGQPSPTDYSETRTQTIMKTQSLLPTAKARKQTKARSKENTTATVQQKEYGILPIPYGLMTVIKFGYSLVIVAILLMIWASLARALELHVDTGHPPCLFQGLCTCSKPAGDLGIVTCNYVPILRVPPAVNSSKVFTLELQGNGIRDLEPYFFQSTGSDDNDESNRKNGAFGPLKCPTLRNDDQQQAFVSLKNAPAVACEKPTCAH
ncbi:Chaoptin [Eumeta japonica]|uniref:Chaoptin n=1 Tax=Eumeta variegata TaxID=151549 RepID=A0A4C1ZW94_EUMVA|nr:Chaoptin [Eumeta japonica]